MSYQRVEFDLTDIPFNRVKRGMNWMCILTGEPGSGKSYAALSLLNRLSSRLGKKFTGWNICFDADILKSRLEGIAPGTPLLFDEAGASFSARRAMSQQNVAMSTVIQTFRFLNIPLIWTVPHIAQIDINARRLMHGHMVAKSWNKSTEETRITYYHIRTPHAGSQEQEIKRTLPRVRTGKSIAKIREFFIDKPPANLVDIYERMATANKNAMIKTGKPAPDMFAEQPEAKNKGVPSMNVRRYKRFPVLSNKRELMRLLSKQGEITPMGDEGCGLSARDLAAQIGCSHTAVYAAIRKYELLPPREEGNL